MRNRGLIFKTACLMVFAVIASAGSFAESRGTNDGVFTEAQVEAGETVYNTHCKACHDAKFYAGILQSWTGQPVSVLFETILGTMPDNNPGMLFEDEVANVMAYIFSTYGYPTGETALSESTDELAKIVIEKLGS